MSPEKETGPGGNGAGQQISADRAQTNTTVALLSAIIDAAACRQVTTVLRFCRPEDVRLLDAPTATALDVALELANAGRVPSAVTLNAELLRRGCYDGHAGELVKARMLAASNPREYAERLTELAAAVLAEVYRARIAAAGHALTTGAATAPELDLWTLLEGEGRAVRAVRDSLATLRKHGGADV
ncbi:MAG: hypothetical protein WAW85_01615 [Gordonia sp. (in: high G+C Gram-positive bacteria)]|uniref:hypothetical protein n=1 Tax=Gordonia sp. (in: high G+C Gram-positive bacteria) TaxID=84139 RepID=UPI003BB73A4E